MFISISSQLDPAWIHREEQALRHAIPFKLLSLVDNTLSEAGSGANRADLMAAQGAFGTDFFDRSILRPKHRAYYRSGRPVIKIGPKGALGSHEIRPIYSAPSLGQSIPEKSVNVEL